MGLLLGSQVRTGHVSHEWRIPGDKHVIVKTSPQRGLLACLPVSVPWGGHGDSGREHALRERAGERRTGADVSCNPRARVM